MMTFKEFYRRSNEDEAKVKPKRSRANRRRGIHQLLIRVRAVKVKRAQLASMNTSN